MGSSKSSSSSSNTTNNYDQSKNTNFEGVQKALMDNAIDVSTNTTNYNYNLASDGAIGNLSDALQVQAQETAQAVKEQKSVTNEIVNSLQSTAKINIVMISAVTATALIGGAYVLTKRKKQ